MSKRAHDSGPGSMKCMEIRGGNLAVEESFEAPGLDQWVYSRPYESAESGGDVHYFSLCGGGIISRLILADVSGHGSAVSEVGASLRKLIRKNINVKKQGRLVRDLNRQFAEVARLSWFATAVVATYLATDRSLTISNAGHPRPFLYRASTKTWEVLDRPVESPGNLPWGLDEETAYHQFSVSLERDDVVLFYTDALVEAADPSGRQLGEDGLIGLARGLTVRDDPREFTIGRDLLQAVADHRGGGEADDDLTLVAWRQNGDGPRHPSLTEKIDVYAKVFGLRDY
ncbi:PP2C family protein-serine/threonine phosphatase [Paludisphaera rhizosphaerae]|uniref:PP2C family protein-serine/threonine phosphatase n=1 Tax=Paludisphaera rhizosphaerae TaxID=2711216 RepID=UPI0013EC1B84|nr:PP2C family protein-serine/threonine phosphatase [Paludisphaera rhizosphaerae]